MDIDLFSLNTFWFIGLGFLLIGYSILDGFDLGVGILYLFVKKDDERRILMNSIGPLWDGNEVWLVTFGGALFAAFPHAYATVFSGFYLAFMLLLAALIFRGVSMEFRSKRESRSWRQFWDFAFFASSFFATFLFGVAVGNSIGGIPIGPDKEYAGAFLELLGPYPLLVGFLALSLFAMHGALYLILKTEGSLQGRAQAWAWKSYACFLVLYIVTTFFTLAFNPGAIRNFSDFPIAWLIVLVNIFALVTIPRALYYRRPGWAFVASCGIIAALIFLFGFALYPNIVISSLNPAWNLDIINSASSQKTLRIMQIVAFLGMPFVILYTAVVYWVFRGKVELGSLSY